jgi:methylaspartate mutase epsilon subunit
MTEHRWANQPAVPIDAGLGAAASHPFGDVVARSHAAGRLVVQPRMGFPDPMRMRAGLIATKRANAATVGTITVDSYTRTGDHGSVTTALRDGHDLNGYPIVTHGPVVTRVMVDGVIDRDFPVQVRHGSAQPWQIISTLLSTGLHATEGGPVSYCLPYGRVPLARSVENWRRSCEALVAVRSAGREPHLETFGGCMMGQLCPPSLLIALSVLEGLFFWQHGLRSISFSYAQQTHQGQDEEAVAALRRLVARLLPGAQSHIVIYTYMGVFPRTCLGAQRLLEESAELAKRTGAARLIVKTSVEAVRIPTIDENVAALEQAAAAAEGSRRIDGQVEQTGIFEQASDLIGAVLDLDDDIGTALRRAFARGYLDVPYCLHPDNAGRTRGALDADGRLQWQEIGALPIGGAARRGTGRMTAAGLIESLSYVRDKYDRAADAGTSTVDRFRGAVS